MRCWHKIKRRQKLTIELHGDYFPIIWLIHASLWKDIIYTTIDPFSKAMYVYTCSFAMHSGLVLWSKPLGDKFWKRLVKECWLTRKSIFGWRQSSKVLQNTWLKALITVTHKTISKRWMSNSILPVVPSSNPSQAVLSALNSIKDRMVQT